MEVKGTARQVYIDAERECWLWDMVHRTDGCWLWRGMTDGMGYGMVQVQGIRFGAARVAWVSVRGERLASTDRLWRKCGERLCVRPDHMRLVRGQRPRDGARPGNHRPYSVLRLGRRSLERDDHVDSRNSPRHTEGASYRNGREKG